MSSMLFHFRWVNASAPMLTCCRPEPKIDQIDLTLRSSPCYATATLRPDLEKCKDRQLKDKKRKQRLVENNEDPNLQAGKG